MKSKEELEKEPMPYDNTTPKKCPKCGNWFLSYPALSRRDNSTYICPDCGVKEAMEDYMNSRKKEGLEEATQKALLEDPENESLTKSLNESVSWDYYDKFEDLINKYMPDQGEGETLASQIVTAVNKLVYKWYNDGDVYDNVNSGLQGWANDLSSYANWLYKYAPGDAPSILKNIYGMGEEADYETLLQELADNLLDENLLSSLEKKKEGSIYDCDGPFEFREYDEDEDEEYYDDYEEDDELDESYSSVEDAKSKLKDKWPTYQDDVEGEYLPIPTRDEYERMWDGEDRSQYANTSYEGFLNALVDSGELTDDNLYNVLLDESKERFDKEELTAVRDSIDTALDDLQLASTGTTGDMEDRALRDDLRNVGNFVDRYIGRMDESKEVMKKEINKDELLNKLEDYVLNQYTEFNDKLYDDFGDIQLNDKDNIKRSIYIYYDIEEDKISVTVGAAGARTFVDTLDEVAQFINAEIAKVNAQDEEVKKLTTESVDNYKDYKINDKIAGVYYQGTDINSLENSSKCNKYKIGEIIGNVVASRVHGDYTVKSGPYKIIGYGSKQKDGKGEGFYIVIGLKGYATVEKGKLYAKQDNLTSISKLREKGQAINYNYSFSMFESKGENLDKEKDAYLTKMNKKYKTFCKNMELDEKDPDDALFALDELEGQFGDEDGEYQELREFIHNELLESKEIKTENNKYLDNMYKDYKDFCNSMDIDEIDPDDAVDAIDEIVQAVRR